MEIYVPVTDAGSTPKAATIDEIKSNESAEIIVTDSAAISVIKGAVPFDVVKIVYSIIDTVKNAVKRTASGYVAVADLEGVTPDIVDVPQNFAGLEAVAVPTRMEPQLFRVVNTVEEDGYVLVTARHVWYDNLQNHTLWKPNETEHYSAAAVSRNVLSNAVSPANMRVASDCTDTKIGKDLDFERKNLVECFLDPEKGICKTFNLNLIRNNWDCYVLKDVGYNRGFVVEDKNNLLGVSRKEDVDPVVTRCCPYGKDEQGEIIWLNNNGTKWVDSPNHFNDYAYPRVELYDTGLQIGKDDVTAQNIQAKLLEAGQKRYSEDHADLPVVELSIQFLSLGDTEEYKQYRDLDKVFLYDIISIKNSEIGYQYTAQVVRVRHDLLTGALLAVDIGKLDNWDGTRKIATWQVPEISGENIRLKSIMAGVFAPGAIMGDDIANGGVRWVHLDAASITQLTTEQLHALNANIKTLIAGSITADDIEAGSITADRIDVEDLAAAFIEVNVLEAAIAAIAEAEIGSANIGFAQIKDADIENLIAHDAVTDRYFIDKLAVRSAQMVQATVGELIVKASDDHYYRLNVNAQGALVTTDVTSSLTNAEKTAGVTSDGHSAIIETDLTVGDLSASNMKAINALIDKLTASRIDVQELFARQATITQLNTVDIRGNQYLQLMVEGYGTTYVQLTDPASEQWNIVKNGDVWYKGFPLTWAQMEDYTWAELEDYTYADLEGYVQYIRQGGAWVEVSDPMEVQHTVTTIGLETDRIALLAEDTWEGLARLSVEASQIAARVANNEGNIAALTLQATQFSLGLQNAQGDIVNISGSLDDLSDDLDSLEITVGNKYTVVSGIAIAAAGVAVSGQKYIKLDVNSGNYVHIDQNGLDIMGNRIKVNGKYVFDREDIIIMNPNSTEVWRRTVAGIESQMNGKHDWVLIRPYYDARILWNLFETYAIQATTVGSAVKKLQQEAGLAQSFGTSTTYQYVFKFTIPVQNFTELGLGLTLANNQALTSNVVTSSGTFQISAVTPTTLELTINSAVNLCAENAEIWFKLESVGRTIGGVSDISLTCKCDSTVSRVPCSTYYYV